MAAKTQVCNNCGEKVSKFYIKCPNCGSNSLRSITPNNTSKSENINYNSFSVKSNFNFKSNLKKWKVCQNCGEDVKLSYDKCPYCNSKNLIITESYTKSPYFSPLKYEVKNNDNFCFKICPRCGNKVNNAVFKCPFCHNEVFEEKTKTDYNFSTTNMSNYSKDEIKTSKVNSTLKRWKVCQNCGEDVQLDYDKCPYCNSKSLLIKESYTKSPKFYQSKTKTDDEIFSFFKHKLFYRKYIDNVYLFSRGKFITFIVFILLCICFIPNSINYTISFIWVLIGTLPFFIVSKNSGDLSDKESVRLRIKNRDDDLVNNIIHFMMYWHDEKTNSFTLSKTKIISILIYIICVLYQTVNTSNLLLALIISLIPFLPALLVGTLIHYILFDEDEKPKVTSQISSEVESKPKITHKKENKPKNIQKRTPKKIEKPKKPVFNTYKLQTEKLESKFYLKEENIRKLIEKRFPGSQLTNTKFNSIVDECNDIFTQRVEIIMTIINSTTQYSLKLENEIKSNIVVLKEINNKLDSLSNELLINMSESSNDDVKDVLDELDRLTDSVKHYE